MSLPEDAWVQAFLQSQPRPLLNNLQKRLAGSTAHINALAELYKQRAAIEQTYAESLSKLARSAESGTLIKSKAEWDGAGESRLWRLAIQDLQETSTSHSTLSSSLRTDFEQPVRDLPNKIIPWRRIGDQDSSLDKNLKDYEKVSGKLEKTSKKPKADALQAELDQITSSLTSLSPMVYTTYQRLDEQRLAGLKEIIVRWGTVRGDMATRDGERAESTIASLLGWEPAEEVLDVGRRLGGGRVPSTTPSRTSDADFRPPPRTNGSSTSTPTFGGIKGMLGRSKTLRKRSDSNSASITSREPEFESLQEERPEPTTVDEEGFSVPPPDRHRTLWDEPEEAPPKLDLGIKSAPIEESEEEKNAAISRIQQSLQMPSAPSRRSTLGRGRRDVRNTMFSPALESPTVTESTVSRASIVEVMNVILRAGQIQRLQVNGEIHVESPPRGPLHVRIDRFERLEKIAPNPQYLTQVPDTPGEYTLDTDTLASRNALLFKYQVHTDHTPLPLTLEPAFLIKNGETRMILNYTATRLLPVTITATFEPGPSVTNVQAKPVGGAWSASSRKITWDLGQVEGSGKIIAKFTTDGELQPANVTASWKTDGLLSDIDINIPEVQKTTTTGKYLAEPVIN